MPSIDEIAAGEVGLALAWLRRNSSSELWISPMKSRAAATVAMAEFLFCG